MKCKHRIEPDIEVMGLIYVLRYACDECCREWEENEVTIVPDVQYQLEQDVITAGREFQKKYQKDKNHRGSCVICRDLEYCPTGLKYRTDLTGSGNNLEKAFDDMDRVLE